MFSTSTAHAYSKLFVWTPLVGPRCRPVSPQGQLCFAKWPPGDAGRAYGMRVTFPETHPVRQPRSESARWSISAGSPVDLHYPSLFRAVPTPCVVLDADLMVRDCNDAYVEVSGRTRAEVIGTNLFAALPTATAGTEPSSRRWRPAGPSSSASSGTRSTLSGPQAPTRGGTTGSAPRCRCRGQVVRGLTSSTTFTTSRPSCLIWVPP